MTLEDAAKILLGEKLGSIRSIHYLSDSERAAPAALGALEVETKTGRFVHIAPTDHEGCSIAAGPVVVATGDERSLNRHWHDLTAELPFAFDGRPVVARFEPLQLRERGQGKRICGCIIEFSNGGRVAYEIRDGKPHLRIDQVGEDRDG